MFQVAAVGVLGGELAAVWREIAARRGAGQDDGKR